MTVGIRVTLRQQHSDIGRFAQALSSRRNRQRMSERCHVACEQQHYDRAQSDDTDQCESASSAVARPEQPNADTGIVREKLQGLEHTASIRFAICEHDGTMTRIAIIGAHGKIGQQLMRLLYDRSDEFVGIARGTDQAEDIFRLGGEGVVLNIETASPDELATAIDGCDAVVFTAGAGGASGIERKKTVDYGGSIKSTQAAAKAGIHRFIQVSAWGVDNPVDADADETWAAYVAAKRDADAALRQSALDWTILRPGGLTSDDGTGTVNLGESVERGSISREDVAGLIVAALDEPKSAGHTWEAVAGDTEITEAVSRLVAGQQDSST